MGLLADYFVGELTQEDTRNAFLYAAGIVICSVSNSFLHAHGYIKGQEASEFWRNFVPGVLQCYSYCDVMLLQYHLTELSFQICIT